jgi:hypothetical protein
MAGLPRLERARATSPVRSAFCILVLALACSTFAPARADAQTVTQRGFVEPTMFLYPQEAPNDPIQVVADLLAREEVFYKPAGWVQFAAGVDARLASYDQTEESWRVDFADRGTRRPNLSVRRLSATITRGRLTLDVGKQFIRWGKTDIVNPTDRFAPRDFLNVVDSEFLGVTGVRAAVQVRGDSLDLVWLPLFTPSRVPLLDQRWTVVPQEAIGVPLVDATSHIPDRSQFGIRWNHPGTAIEYSFSFFDGLNHLPNVESTAEFNPLRIAIRRVYPEIRSYGADAAMPTRWMTVRAEAAYVVSSTAGTDEYVLYVIQLERQTGEWLFVGGYSGEVVTNRRAVLTFAPDRGLARAFVGRASYTIDANRSVAFEAAVRQNGDGEWVKGEYSQVRGNHWRVTATATLIAGHSDDFLGQYHRNSHLLLSARYSF